jgi:hypothetical protein
MNVYVAHDLLIQIHQFCHHRTLKPQKHYYISVSVHKAKQITVLKILPIFKTTYKCEGLL